MHSVKLSTNAYLSPEPPRRGNRDNSPPGMKLNEIPLGTAGNWDASIQETLGFQVGLGEVSMFHYSKHGSRTVGNCRMFESFVTWYIFVDLCLVVDLRCKPCRFITFSSGCRNKADCHLVETTIAAIDRWDFPRMFYRKPIVFTMNFEGFC